MVELVDRIVKSVSQREIRELSAENIADLLLPHSKIVTLPSQQVGHGKEEQSESEQSEMRVDGKPIDGLPEVRDEVYSGDGEKLTEGQLSSLDSNQMEQQLKDIVAKATTFSKMAGREEPAGERILRELMRPKKAPWWRLLKETIESDFKNVLTDWRRESRKVDGLPGSRWLGVHRVWCLIDVSGSISEKEYMKFVGVIYDLVKRGLEVYAVFWDTRTS
ncbi:MAG: hypothetical protein ACK4GQ_06515, partial [Candidatus Hadarchaeales archaeon]